VAGFCVSGFSIADEADSSEEYDEVLPQVAGFCVSGFSIAITVAFE